MVHDVDGLPMFVLKGSPGEIGFTHGRLVRHLFNELRQPYLDAVQRVNRYDEGGLTERALDWVADLPVHVQEEIDGMAVGAEVPVGHVADVLFADIATSETNPAAAPMCSGVMLPVDRRPWIARNCDWLIATLMRGTSVVVHDLPGRIPCLGMGINGDIDVDTGMNAERLWLHVHTLPAMDRARSDRPIISWLFWVREALETCATLEEIEAMLERVDRDRGMLLFAAEGRTGRSALYECARSTFRRIDSPDGVTIATNHCAHQHPDAQRLERSRPGSTLRRYGRLRELMADRRPERGPEDLIRMLA
ncbi:MAG: hypothetical protein EA377_14325, partial [Phycisphaerales bacterium]